MTAATIDRKAPQYGSQVGPLPDLISLPMAASAKIFAGTMVAKDASGNAVPASALAALIVVGRAEKQVDNTGGAAGALSINAAPGVYAFNNSAGADAITAANAFQYCFAVDDNTVALTDGGGTRPLAGMIFPFDPAYPTLVMVGVGPGFANAYQNNPLLATSGTSFRARNVVTVAVVLATGLTVATNDGVTNVAGDVVFLAAQAAPAQNGPYVVGTVTAGVAPLTRPDWWPTGAVLKTGISVAMGGEGTVYKNTTWRAMLAADSFTVDTTDPKLYPVRVSGQTALTAGTFTISVPVFSAKSNVLLARVATGGTVTTTIQYCPTVAGATGITPGPIGTGQAVVQACVAAGTIQNTDTSTLNWTIENQP